MNTQLGANGLLLLVSILEKGWLISGSNNF